MKANTKLALQSWKPAFLFFEPYLPANNKKKNVSVIADLQISKVQ